MYGYFQKQTGRISYKKPGHGYKREILREKLNSQLYKSENR